MNGAQAIGTALLSTTAITAIVGAGTAGRVYHGLRPANSIVPSINYFKIGGITRYGITSEKYSINCRASTATAAVNLAKQVDILFGGIEGMSTYSDWSGFDIVRASTQQDQGLIPEPADGVFNAPIDIQIVYRVETAT